LAREAAAPACDDAAVAVLAADTVDRGAAETAAAVCSLGAAEAAHADLAMVAAPPDPCENGSGGGTEETLTRLDVRGEMSPVASESAPTDCCDGDCNGKQGAMSVRGPDEAPELGSNVSGADIGNKGEGCCSCCGGAALLGCAVAATAVRMSGGSV